MLPCRVGAGALMLLSMASSGTCGWQDADRGLVSDDGVADAGYGAGNESRRPRRPAVPGAIRRCTVAETQLQGALFKRAQTFPGCMKQLWMQIIHLQLPYATTFIDVGTNKGYESVAFLEFWNPELGLTPHIWHRTLLALFRTKESFQGCGTCEDCKDRHLPLLYPFAAMLGSARGGDEAHRFEDHAGTFGGRRWRPIRIFGFDGNVELVNGLKEAIRFVSERPGWLKNRSKWVDPAVLPLHWHVQLGAVTGSCAPGETLDFRQDQGELGGLGDHPELGPGAKRSVPCITIDQFVEKQGLEHIDVMKIDAEHWDQEVVRGAMGSLRRGLVGVFLFEYNFPQKPTFHARLEVSDRPAAALLVDELEAVGYVCYLAGQRFLLRMTACWHPNFRNHHWSNVICVSLRHHPGLVHIFDSFSAAFLPATAHIT